MTFNDVLEMGVACGLSTVSEAILNFELHSTQLLCYSEHDAICKQVYTEYASYKANGGSDTIAKDIVDKVNREMEDAAKEWKEIAVDL